MKGKPLNMKLFDKQKYDRQIRLFGKNVQHKLTALSVSILSSNENNFVSGEILKNLVLLGVGNIYADANTIISFGKLVPNKIKDINPKVNILDKAEGIYFIIDDILVPKAEKVFYISSKKLEYSTFSSNFLNDTSKIINENNSSSDVVKECLLGGIIVQEFIKMIQNQTYQTSYML